MFYSQKKSFKGTNSKGKAVEADRWDHGGFEQLQQERNRNSFVEENSNKFKKSNKYNQDSTLASDSLELISHDNLSSDINKKWNHDRFEDISNNPSLSKVESTPKEDDTKRRRERKPDKPLYSVRNKHPKNDELLKTNTTSTPRTPKFDESTPKAKYYKDFLSTEDKETTAFEDDKSFISNVSTAISDRKNLEDEIASYKEGKLDILHERGTAEKCSSTKKDDSHVLFELCIDNERPGDIIKVYDNEEDYESFLETVCNNVGVKNELALYLQIYILQLIQEAHPEPQKIEPLLNKYLDINYKLMMLEYSKSAMEDFEFDLADIDSSQTVRENSN